MLRRHRLRPAAEGYLTILLYAYYDAARRCDLELWDTDPSS